MKNYSSILLHLTITILSLLLITIEGKLPSYIHVCRRNHPKLNDCIKSSISNLTLKLIEGMPELDIPSIDPIMLKELPLKLGPGFKAVNRNLTMRGARNFKIEHLSVDIEKHTYKFTVSIPAISVTGTYELDAALGPIPLKGTGPFDFSATSVSGTGILHSRKINHGGEDRLDLMSLSLALAVGNYSIALKNVLGGDPTIGEVTNKILNDEKAEILPRVLPYMEEAIAEYLLLAGNNICKHFSWNELFP